MSLFLSRMHPWETRPGRRSGRFVPWMPMNPPAGQSVSVGDRALVPNAIGTVEGVRVSGELVADVVLPCGRGLPPGRPAPTIGARGLGSAVAVERRASGARGRRSSGVRDGAVAAERRPRHPAGGCRCPGSGVATRPTGHALAVATSCRGPTTAIAGSLGVCASTRRGERPGRRCRSAAHAHAWPAPPDWRPEGDVLETRQGLSSAGGTTGADRSGSSATAPRCGRRVWVRVAAEAGREAGPEGDCDGNRDDRDKGPPGGWSPIRDVIP